MQQASKSLAKSQCTLFARDDIRIPDLDDNQHDCCFVPSRRQGSQSSRWTRWNDFRTGCLRSLDWIWGELPALPKGRRWKRLTAPYVVGKRLDRVCSGLLAMNKLRRKTSLDRRFTFITVSYFPTAEESRETGTRTTTGRGIRMEKKP